MLVFKHLLYYYILLKVKVVEVVTTQYFSRSKKHILEIPIPLMKMAYIMLVFWKKSSFLVSGNQVWVIVCKTLLANVGATGINIEQYLGGDGIKSLDVVCLFAHEMF